VFNITDYLHKLSSDKSVTNVFPFVGYGNYDRGSRVRFPTGAVYFFLQHRVLNGSGAHPASYPMGKAARA
jgi:hypothetical protein